MADKYVVFASQVQTAAFVQLVESDSSPEFHPGLRNSATNVEVQAAIDIVSALPAAPPLARFSNLDIATQLPPVDAKSLSQKLRANQQQITAEQAVARQEIMRQAQQQRAAAEKRHQELLDAFEQRTQPAAKPKPDADEKPDSQ